MTLLTDLRLRGQALPAAIQQCVTDCSIELTAPGQSQLSLTLIDPDLRWTELFTRGAELDWAYQQWSAIKVRVAAGTGDRPRLEVTARNRPVRLLMQRTGARTWDGVSPLVWLRAEAAAVGAGVVGEDAPARLIERRSEPGETNPESSWDVARALAAELGVWLFEAGGVVYFARPSWLVARTGQAPVWRWDDPNMVRRPELNASDEAARLGKSPATVTATFPVDAARFYRPGQVVKVEIRGFTGMYLVTSTSMSDARPLECTVEVATPIDPDPSRASTSSGRSGGTIDPIDLPSMSGSNGSRMLGGATAATLVALARAQVGDRYVLGSGRNVSNPDPDTFDCSGLVYWACGRVGVTVPNTARGIAQHCAARRPVSIGDAARIPGALVWRTQSNIAAGTTGHVAICVGDGASTIEAKGTAYGVVRDVIAGRGFDGAGLIPGLFYPGQVGNPVVQGKDPPL